MNSDRRKRNRRLFREAEGYLELATLFDDQFMLDSDRKSQLADRCIATLDQIEQPGTRQSRVLYLKGQALRLAERYDQAIEVLERAFQLDSSNIHTCLALAWCFKRRDQVGLAVEAMQQALDIDRDSGIAHYNMACYLSLLQQTELALIHLARSIEIDPIYRELALQEADFDPIRDDPRFREKTVPV
jgi:tetratricopeptide (TPR) repeat protein